MKLRIRSQSTGGPAELDFHEDGGNTLSCIARLKPDRARSADALNKVSVTTQAETSKGGVRRILVRVSMPYMALDPASVDGNASNLTYSPTRSGRTISVHAVITLPREAVEDLRGQRVGSAGVASASGQIAMLQNTLIGILEPLGNRLDTEDVPGTKFVIAALELDEVNNILTPTASSVGSEPGTTETMVTSADSLVTRALLGSTPLNSEQVIGKPIMAA